MRIRCPINGRRSHGGATPQHVARLLLQNRHFTSNPANLCCAETFDLRHDHAESASSQAKAQFTGTIP